MTLQKNAMTEVAQHLPDAPIPPMIAVGAVALQMALQYHDINTIHDGALYQQYKIEGKNMTPLMLDLVFDTARRIEEHLMATSNRIAGIVVDTLSEGIALEQDWEARIQEIVEDPLGDEEFNLRLKLRWNTINFSDVGSEDNDRLLLNIFMDLEDLDEKLTKRFVDFIHSDEEVLKKPLLAALNVIVGSIPSGVTE